MKNALFISMLGEREHFRSEDYVSLCKSGKEKDWVVDWHSAIAEEAGYKLFGVDICHGEKLPDSNNVDSVILGGTLHVVTEDRKWLHDLRNWLRDYRKSKHPLLAICGGHQMLSSQFGDGELTGRSEGTLAGTYQIIVTDDNLCTDTLSHTINEPSVLTVIQDPDNASTDMLDCYQDDDGVINVLDLVSMVDLILN